MIKFGLRSKMLVIITTLLILSFSVIAAGGFVQMKSIVIKQSEEHLITKSDYMKEKITNFFSQRQMLLNNESQYASEFFKDYAAIIPDDARKGIKSHLTASLKTMKEKYGIIDIYIGYPDGSVGCGSGWVPESPDWKSNERPWYKAALEAKGGLVYTDVYVDSDTRKPVVTLSQAIKGSSGSEYAVIGIDVGLAQLSDLISKEKIGQTGYTFVLDKDARFLIHPQYSFNEDLSKADTIFNVSGGSLKEIGRQVLAEKSEIINGSLDGVKKVYYSQKIKGTGFYIVSTLFENDFTKELYELAGSIAIIIVITMLFLIAFIFIFIGRITKIISGIANGMQQMSSGNLAFEMKRINRRDELGVLVASINTMRDSVKSIISSIKTETENLNNALAVSERNIYELTANLEETSATVEQLSAGMEETAATTQAVNVTSSEIELSVEAIASKTRDGALSAGEISKKAVALRDSSEMLQNEAYKTQLDIKASMDSALTKIKEVEKIKELADSILQISSQTNLLALNAAIESARAGEAGKGFSVVAEEIRKLADVSKETVNEIQSTVNKVFEAVDDLVNASQSTLGYIETKVVDSYRESLSVGENYIKDADLVNDMVKGLSEISGQLLAAIKAVAVSMEGISEASNQGAEGTNSITEKVLMINDRANDIKTEIANVKNSADILVNHVSRFRV